MYANPGSCTDLPVAFRSPPANSETEESQDLRDIGGAYRQSHSSVAQNKVRTGAPNVVSTTYAKNVSIEGNVSPSTNVVLEHLSVSTLRVVTIFMEPSAASITLVPGKGLVPKNVVLSLVPGDVLPDAVLKGPRVQQHVPTGGPLRVPASQSPGPEVNKGPKRRVGL